MRNFFTSIGVVFVILSFSISSLFAQATATANISSTIVTPISISKTVDVNFGNVSVSGTAGTVILTPVGTRSATGGVTLPATTGTLTAASFTITGQGSYTYSITLPSSALTISSGSDVMTIDNFTSSSSTTGTLSSGTQTLKVGATLHISGNQAAGTYLSAAPFSVTVNYN
jgi:hypothetical protein